MSTATLLRQLPCLLLCLLIGGRLSAQNPVTWDTPTPCSWTPNISANNITNGPGYGGPHAPCGAASKNVLPSCRPSGYVSSKLAAIYSTTFGWEETVMLGLDDSGSVNYPNNVDYAITLTAKSGGVYTLTAGKGCHPVLLTFDNVLYTANITPSANSIYKILRSGTNISFYRDDILLATTPWNNNKLKVFALLLPYAMGAISDVNTDFGVPDACGNTDDNDWKGAGTGTLAPFNNNDNVYVPAKVGIGVASPVEKLEVAGRVKIGTIDNDNAQTQLLVNAGGVVKYRDVSTLPPTIDWDWRTTAGLAPTSLNDQIYKNGRVGINTSSINASLHVVNGSCDNQPAFRVSDVCGLGCTFPNNHGDLVYVENCNVNTYVPAFVVKQSGAVGVGTANPNAKLTVSTAGINDGIRVTQTGSGFAGVTLENQTAGGKMWGLLSLGSGNGQGTGNFLIYNGSNGSNTFLIDGATGNVGIGHTSPGIYRLNINGDTYTSGNYFGSDRRFKNNIVPVRDAMKLISALEGVRYTFKDDLYFPQPEGSKDAPVKRNFPKGTQLGLIAQDVEKVLPEVVRTDDDGYKAVAYQNIVALLIEGLKEQEKKMEELQRRLEALESGKAPATQPAGFTDAAATTDASRLAQSVPNPTGGPTEIAYYLAGNVTKASIVLYTIDGVEARRFSLTPVKGNGRITVHAAELQSGTYIYSLITNDGIADTKKMTVVK